MAAAITLLLLPRVFSPLVSCPKKFDSTLGLLDGINKMKTKLISAIGAVLILSMATPCMAQDDDDGVLVMADVVLVRPACFVSTVVGSVFFVLALPFAAMSKSIKKTANTLVVKPAKATFTRPVGDMESLSAYY